MERLARDDASAVLDLIVGHIIDAGMAGHVALFLVVRLNLAKQLRGGLELVRREVLVAHHQHVMRGECAAQQGAVLAIDRLREIEVGDHDAGVRSQGRDGQRHCMTLHAHVVSKR